MGGRFMTIDVILSEELPTEIKLNKYVKTLMVL